MKLLTDLLSKFLYKKALPSVNKNNVTEEFQHSVLLHGIREWLRSSCSLLAADSSSSKRTHPALKPPFAAASSLSSALCSSIYGRQTSNVSMDPKSHDQH